MDEKLTVSYIVYESEQARNERHIRRLFIALIISILLTFATNAIWLYEWTQYDYSGSEIVSIDGKEGIANYIGNNGNINNGENSGSKDADPEEKEWQE